MKKFNELFLDLDGVMFDFDGGVKKITGKLPHELDKREMWKRINSTPNFFFNLDLLPRAMEMYRYIKTLEMTHDVKTRILTGLPSMTGSADQKRRAVAQYIDQDLEVIVLPSKNKVLHAKPNAILIDDREEMTSPWSRQGGFAILHRSVDETIEILKATFP